MENLRKSFRASLRRKKDKDAAHSTGDFVKDRTGGSSKSKLWQQDEIAVRAGTCSFEVKYLGGMEVFESRGMNVCEEALKKLKSSKKKSVRAILYVNGDGLRVVDNETKGLLVDQTIEKVSFCAPDHNYERGFSYICRDGTTRRWMCHGFMAVKETGDRLSHAVGCAFAICLEKKQKRDQDCAVTMSFDKGNSSFTRIGSFRQATITERLADPQGIKPSEPPPKPLSASGEDANPFAIARPHATDIMLQRQTSFREFSRLQSRTSPFKRQLSLRMSELPSSLERKNNDAVQLGSTNEVMVQSKDPFGELCEQFKNQAFFSNSLFVKGESSKLTTVPEDEDSLPPPMMASPIKPLKPSVASAAAPIVEVVEPTILEEDEEDQEEEESILDEEDNNLPETSSNSVMITSSKSLPFDGDNPWDLVPDQPSKISNSNNKIDIIHANKESLDIWPPPLVHKEHHQLKPHNDIEHNLMDDPFDADWVSLALNQNNNQTNNHQQQQQENNPI